MIAIENTRLLSELRQSLAAADRDRRRAQGHQSVDFRSQDRPQYSGGVCCPALRRGHGIHPTTDGRNLRPCRNLRLSAGFPGVSSTEPNFAWSEVPLTGRAVLEGKTIHIPDVLADPEYSLIEGAENGRISNRSWRSTDARRRRYRRPGVGALRSRGRSLTNRSNWSTTFADQAVIAIENVRLFESVEARTRELAKSLEDLRTTQDRLVQTQKLASLGQLTAGIAHEIKNPLNFVNNFSGGLCRADRRIAEALKDVNLDNKRRAEITEMRTRCRAISTRSCSTASAPMPSSRTCCCTHAKARANTGLSISMPSSRKASISPITGRGPRSRASTSPWSGRWIRPLVKPMCFRRTSRGLC